MATLDRTAAERATGRERAAAARPRDLTERINLHARAVAIGVLIALIGIGAFGRFYTARFSGLVSPQAMEIGDIAQQLRYHNSFSTRVVRPLVLSYATPDQYGTVPDTRHQPLYPALLSLLFRVRGGGDASVAMFNGLMFLLTGWVIFVIARMLWDKPIGLLAAALYFVSIDAIGHALTATGASLAGLLVTVAIWAALRTRMSAEDAEAEGRGRGSLLWPAVVGVVFGLAYLSGTTAALLVIPVAMLAAAPGRGRLRRAAIIAAVSLVVVTPWLVRNWSVSGTPVPMLAAYELIADTRTYPTDTIYSHMPGEVPSPLAFAISHPGDMIHKAGRGLTMLYRSAPGMLTPYLFPFFVIGAFIFGTHNLKRSLWRAVLAMILLQALSISLYGLRPDGMTVLLPAAICLAAAGLVEILRRADAPRWSTVAVGAAIVALVLFPTASSAILGGKTAVNPARAAMDFIDQGLLEGAVIASDRPELVAWYGRRTAVALPASPTDLARLDQTALKPHYIFLTADVFQNPVRTGLLPWHNYLTQEDAPQELGTLVGGRPGAEVLLEREQMRVGQNTDA
ncbi:MAG: ArnT family glycosyltransferase [Armatimonadota bacterium]|jgi:hypothetical protein